MATIRFSRTIHTDCSKIYSLITEQDELTKWFAPWVITTPKQGTFAAFAFKEDTNFQVLLKKLELNKLIVWEFSVGNVDWNGSIISFR